MDTIRFKFDEFNRRQTELRNSSWQNAEETSRQAIVIIITLGIFLGVSLAVMSLLQLRRLSRNYTTAYTSLSEATDHLEEVVAQRTHELVLVNKELEAFSYSVSHDLRSPLRGIDGFSQMLVEEYSDKLDKEAIKYLGFIRAGVQKMGMLIDDLINLSRLTRAEFKKSEVDISVISADIIKELKDQSPERKLEFVNFSPQKIQADPGLLRAALQNLLLNAWKYSRYEEISRIELGQILKDNKLTYFVKDNGVGFDMRYYDKLFQPFQRLHPNDKFDGTGIGLATVARIIRRHNGTIWGESEVGIGTIFYFTLGS
jgi:light-regulated signal transduction histidine kinase (bacteriophytochrome)